MIFQNMLRRHSSQEDHFNSFLPQFLAAKNRVETDEFVSRWI